MTRVKSADAWIISGTLHSFRLLVVYLMLKEFKIAVFPPHLTGDTVLPIELCEILAPF